MQARCCAGCILQNAAIHPGEHRCSVTEGERLLIYTICGLIFSLWILPVYLITGLNTYRSLFGVCTLAAFVISMMLLFSIQKPFS
jgi:hypothetical protein